MTWQLLTGDCREWLHEFPPHSFDSSVTDAPYEIGILGAKWDKTGVATEPGAWGEVRRVLKPGAFLLNFTAARTYHRIACAIEDAGFTLLPPIAWIFGSGMPPGGRLDAKIDKMLGIERKSIGTRTLRGNAALDCAEKGGNYSVGAKANGRSREVAITQAASPEAQRWEGWGMHLRPSLELIVMAQAPFKGSKTRNVLEHGTGALNIADCAIPVSNSDQVRWPPNVVLNHAAECTESQCALWCPVRHLEEITGEHPSAGNKRPTTGRGAFHGQSGRRGWAIEEVSKGDSGTAARYFHHFRYQAKAAASEKTAGGQVEEHETTKPVEFVAWLVRLVTQPGGHVLDPFAGGGTTLIACERQGFQSTGIELRAHAAAEARKRVLIMTKGYDGRPLGEVSRG